MPRKHVNAVHLVINGSDNDRVLNFQFLGLTLIENLNWKSHINNVSNKISKNIGIINKLKHFIPMKTKVLIYIQYTCMGLSMWQSDKTSISKPAYYYQLGE